MTKQQKMKKRTKEQRSKRVDVSSNLRKRAGAETLTSAAEKRRKGQRPSARHKIATPPNKERSKAKKTKIKPTEHEQKKAKQPTSIRKKGQKQSAKAMAQRNKKLRLLLINLALTAIVTLVLWSIGLSFFFGVSNVSGYGMSPTLMQGEVVLINRTRIPKRFDMVLFRRGNTKQIRRLIGFPGETIAYKDDHLLVEGAVVDEKFLVDKINESQRNGQNYTEDFTVYDLLDRQALPEGKYLLLGDNRPYATDSRHYGLVDESAIIGVVQARLFPLDEWMVY